MLFGPEKYVGNYYVENIIHRQSLLTSPPSDKSVERNYDTHYVSKKLTYVKPLNVQNLIPLMYFYHNNSLPTPRLPISYRRRY
jgi:hypothetical protein